MAEILSQSQIDELLNNLSSGDVDIKNIDASEKKIREYDFRSPRKITKETIKLLNGIYENYCRMLTSRLTSILRLSCDITVEQVEESVFHEYNNALDDYVLMGLIDVRYPDNTTSDSQILLEISKPISFVIIDRLLGGPGVEYDTQRDYTDIELSLLHNLIKQIVPLMGKTWEGTLDMKTELDKIETNSRFIQSVNYNDTVVVIVLDIVLNQSSGKITICLPSAILDNITRRANAYLRSGSKKPDQNIKEQKQVIMNSIKSSELTITGVLGKTRVTLQDIINMQPGDLIVLDKNVNSNIDVNINGEKWFEGRWGTKKKRTAIKINKIIR